jgi:glyoxylase-like metal-dependent hydrolase (beta-lactamase superfamily II)
MFSIGGNKARRRMVITNVGVRRDPHSTRNARRVSKEKAMWTLSRRGALASAAAAAAFGLTKPLTIIAPALAETPLEPTVGHYKYNFGSIEITAIYDGIWRKPHDPTFIKNVSVEETKAALAKAGLATDFMPIPLTVIVLKIGDKLIMVDAGSGVGQWQANATHLPANMLAAGIDHNNIGTVLVSHFHPDHVWGLMEKGTNAPTFPNAELIVNAVEYNFWTEEGRVEKLPEGRRAAGRRIAETFPKWKNWRLVDAGTEVAPGVQILDAYGHTPGHSAFLVSSGKDQLMISNDTMYVPGILAPHPEWQGAYDQDGPLAITTRRRIIDRVIADRMQICGAHFPFPGAGTFVKDGGAYAYTPVIQS